MRGRTLTGLLLILLVIEMGGGTCTLRVETTSYPLGDYMLLLPPKLAKDFYPDGFTREELLAKLPEAVGKTGHIDRNETWEGVVRVTGDLEICGGVTVLINPGTIVFVAAKSDDQRGGVAEHQDLFNPKDPVKTEDYVKSRVWIQINGRLIAKGTEELPIIITSDAKEPQSDDWLGISANPPNAVLEFERVIIEYFRVFGIGSSYVRISKSILRNMMEAVVVMGQEEELISVSPIITQSYVYNCGHHCITVRSGSPIITHNVIRARPDMEFPGFEYGAMAVDFFAKLVIEHNFIEGGLPVRYEEYDIWGRYHNFIEGNGLIMHAYFGAYIAYNTFYNCSGIGMEVNPYLWTIENNNFLNNKVNLELHEHFEPESSDIWQQELLEKFTVTPLEFVSLANNYWGATDEEQIRNLIAIHGTTEVSLEPFKTSFIKEALPNWQEFRWNGARSLSIISCSVSRKTMVSGQGIIISGLISPTHEATVTITIEVPNGTILTRTAVTDHNGEFEYSFNPDAEGIWNITASWGGDEDHQGSSSPRISFVVKAPPPPWESYASIAAVAIVAIGAAAMIYRRRRAKAHSAR